MTGPVPTPEQAARALAEVDQRRRQIADLAWPPPRWATPVMAVLLFAEIALWDLGDFAIWLFEIPLFALIVLTDWMYWRSNRVRLVRSLWGAAGNRTMAVVALVGVPIFLATLVYFGSLDSPLRFTFAGAVMAGQAAVASWFVTWRLGRLIERNLGVRQRADRPSTDFERGTA